MDLRQLTSLFKQAGCTKLYAKKLSENDNSKNQIYLAGAVEALNAFPSQEIFAENTSQGPSFKAKLNFGWLLENGNVDPAPNAQLILYSQYPEVRFSGFLRGSKNGPNELMADRGRAKKFSPQTARKLVNRVLFLGVTPAGRTIGYVVAGNSQIATEFRESEFTMAFVVFHEIPIPGELDTQTARARLLAELGRVHRLGWIDSKQLDSNGVYSPCNASQCGGLTLEAELGIPKNSRSDPDFLGWEIKQYSVSNFERINNTTPITLMTPEPSGGYYQVNGVEAFIRKFGYPDKKGRADRMNFGGRHYVGKFCKTTNLKMELVGYDFEKRKINDANGEVALVSSRGEVAASWEFRKILKHWSHKHAQAVYVPSMCETEPKRQYSYGHCVRLAERTDSLRFLHAFAFQAVFYDPGIKLENASTAPETKRRSQFRILAKNITELYESIENVEV